MVEGTGLEMRICPYHRVSLRPKQSGIPVIFAGATYRKSRPVSSSITPSGGNPVAIFKSGWSAPLEEIPIGAFQIPAKDERTQPRKSVGMADLMNSHLAKSLANTAHFSSAGNADPSPDEAEIRRAYGEWCKWTRKLDCEELTDEEGNEARKHVTAAYFAIARWKAPTAEMTAWKVHMLERELRAGLPTDNRDSIMLASIKSDLLSM